jgi:hypothetical protein
MDTESTLAILNPVIQYGFAGFCAILLAIIVWLMKRLMDLLEQNNRVLAENTGVIKSLYAQGDKTKEAVWEMREEFLRRPCISQK